MTNITVSDPAGIIDEENDGFTALNRMARGWGYPENTAGGIRDAALAAVAEAAISNPIIKFGIEAGTVNLQGPRGLRPTPKLNANLLGLTEQEAEDIAEAFESIWDEWSTSTDATTAGNMTFPAAMESAIRRAFSTGEILLSVNLDIDPSRTFATGITALDTNRISRYTVNSGDVPDDHKILQGVEMHEQTGRMSALYLTKPLRQYGQQQVSMYGMQAERHEVANEWGRPKLVFSVMDRLGPGAVRGVSPIVAAMERALMIDKTEGALLDQTLEILKIAWQLSTDLPTGQAELLIAPEDRRAHYQEMADRLTNYFGKVPLRLPFGTQVSIMPPGTSLKTTSPQVPGGQIDILFARLYGEIARAFGMSYSELTGDYSRDTYSSSRMGSLTPWSLIYQRRNSFIVPVYQAVYGCVIEEAIARGMVNLPRKSAPFWHNRTAWTKCDWAGPTRPSVDTLKDAQADDLALSNGSKTLADIGTERGFDWRESLEQRAREKAYAEKLGLDLYSAKTKAATPQPMESED